jgi:hypothetical protein
MRTSARSVAGTRGSHPMGAILALAVVMAMEHRSHGKNLNLAMFDTNSSRVSFDNRCIACNLDNINTSSEPHRW